ncbi:hypothetical protein MKEN_00933800 [Mycena kentingensis (nom. inval.)]|nr:hypothetical protein MKEN_00933800 [Mycena kentingensis (nom. inval.)]
MLRTNSRESTSMLLTSPFPPLPPLPDLNIYNLLFNRPDQAEWPEYTFQVDHKTGRKRTLKEAQAQIALAATAFTTPILAGGLGLKPDSETETIVALVGHNSLEYYDAVLSLLCITIPCALISAYSTRRELVHGLKLVKATHVLVDAKLLKNVLDAIDADPELRQQLDADKVRILAGAPSKHAGPKSLVEMVDSVKQANLPIESIRPATKDTLAYLVMSSGTSGLPKAVMITHGNLVSMTLQSITAAQLTDIYNGPPRTKTIPSVLAVMPLFHSYGLHVYLFRATLAPATFVFFERWNLTEWLRAIPKYKITYLTLVPSFVHQIVDHPDFMKTDMRSVEGILSGGAHLPPALANRLTGHLRKNVQLTIGYGLSECTLMAHSRPPPGAFGHVNGTPENSTGVLIPGMTGRIVRDDGSDAPLGDVGELWIKGPNVSPGYWNNPAANKETFVDGWLRTGDFFSLDKAGFFYFADRGKDTLKVSGAQVSPKEIEDVLFAHPEKLVSDVSVAGVSGGRTADEKVPRAWVMLSDSGKRKGREASVDALVTWHREQLSRYKWLRGGIEVVNEIPKSPTGKTMRRVLQEEYEKQVRAGNSGLVAAKL